MKLANTKARKISPVNRKRMLSCECLETRQLMAVFGTPWPDARNLQVSFPSDSAQIGGYDNSMRRVFDQVADRREWQEAALRAFQTWAVQANVNVGLAPDRGDDFGTVGLASNDPRFGEFRIGAFPQPGVLANALPFQQIAGTWSGDVLLNTQTNYFLGDWQSTSPIAVPPPNAKGPAVELFSVLLHEAGNALGIADNNRAGTVMFRNYEGPKGTLTSTDLSAIRRIYGARQDIYETVANNTRGTATRIPVPQGYSLDQPISARGSLNSLADVDFYKFTPIAGQEKVVVRLWASGISLVKSKIEILDRFGNKIADAKADSIFDNNIQIEVGSLSTHRELIVKVSRNTSDVFAIGDYRVDIDYRPLDQQPSIHSPSHDADADDDDSNAVIDYVSVDQLFAQAGLVDLEVGANDTLATAVVLETAPGYVTGTRFEAQAALSGAADRDFYRFLAPATTDGILNVEVNPVGIDNPTVELVVMNAAGDRVAGQFRRKAEGGASIEIVHPVAGQDYIVAVRNVNGSAVVAGNYVLTVDFATESANPTEVFRNTLSGSQERFSGLTVNKTQLFRFDLSAQANSLDQGVQLTIYDARTRQIVFSMAAASQSRSTDYVWLAKGNYILRTTVRTRGSQLPGNIHFSVSADGISDDQGPNPIDPTQPNIPPPAEVDCCMPYPVNGIDIIDFPIPVYEDPWFDEFGIDFVDDFYPIHYV